MAVVLKELDTLQLDTKVEDVSLTLTRSEDGQDMQRCMRCGSRMIPDTNLHFLSVCEILSTVGTSIVIDMTYNHWTEGYDLIRSQGIAYVRLERILRPFLEMFGDFMRQKRANNVAMVFMNARDAGEATHQMLIGYPFRTLILDASQDDPGQDFLERIRTLRPSPAYVGLFARGGAMNGIFERV